MLALLVCVAGVRVRMPVARLRVGMPVARLK